MEANHRETAQPGRIDAARRARVLGRGHNVGRHCWLVQQCLAARRVAAAILALAIPGLAAFGFAARAATAEPPANSAAATQLASWADAALPIQDGLWIWLDATRHEAAQQAHGAAPAKTSEQTATWRDASPHARDVEQSVPELRPTFQIGPDGYRAFRFDGAAQRLARVATDPPFEALTVFIVAAPVENRGGWRGLVSMNAPGANDYTSGMTIDLGPWPTKLAEVVNVEGAGFSGADNLLKEKGDLGALHALCVTSAPGAGGVRLYQNGQPQKRRDRADSRIAVDRLTIGGRHYGFPAVDQGFFAGDIVEVLIYDRALADEERAKIDAYLAAKHPQLGQVVVTPPPVPGKPLVRVESPPAVQVLSPGFAAIKLPLDLPNINNVLYRPDGKLVALAYDGDIYLLSDTDGDGLEDQAEKFWDNRGRLRAPIGMALTPPNYPQGQGAFMPSKEKCSLIVDVDGDDVADREIIIADGWKEMGHGVDAVGAAFDPRDGSVYFGLGAASYTLPYLVNKEGIAEYSLASQRGTILRVAPDFKSRSIVCTGVRFPIGIRFDRDGELFCTDQEGATWLSNGNPFDELLHIQTGRHYGFPPRHPRHLPEVIDEPSVYDYRPQHQSTCGMNFNEPVNGGPAFGPAWWKSNALVAGYSRGKLYRTTIVKTPAGYVAGNQLLAHTSAMPPDVCVSPQGELVVPMHSGLPDWGTGPAGRGELFKIRYVDAAAPQPVLAWFEGPDELRIAFDRPLAVEALQGIAGQTTLESGRYVAAADRFESLWPNYQVVMDQQATPRYAAPVFSIGLTADRTTLVVATAAQTAPANVAVTLPTLAAKRDGFAGEVAQAPVVDLLADLSGVSLRWTSADGAQSTGGWLPHIDLAASRGLAAGSAAHDRLWTLLESPGELTLSTQIDLVDMLRPAVQPGSDPGYKLPAEEVTLVFTANREFALAVASADVPCARSADGAWRAEATFAPADGAPLPVALRVATRTEPLELSLAFHTREDARPRALATRRLLLPWVEPGDDDAHAPAKREIPELAGGDWARGRRVFLGAKANCSTCHAMHGEGGAIGPNLSNLQHRDYASVLRDVATPSAVINPDFIAHSIALSDGRIVQGIVRAAGDELSIGTTEGKLVRVARADVEQLVPSAASIMPDQLLKELTSDEQRDLLTFLLTPPPHMPDYGDQPPPPPRTLQQVEQVLAGASPRPEQWKPLNIVLVAGRKDHGPGEHDYPAWQAAWRPLLASAEHVEVSTADGWPDAAALDKADVMVLYQQGTWTPERQRDLDKLLARGGGVALIHYAVDGGRDAPGFAERIGLAWNGPQSRFRHGPLQLDFGPGRGHPIARNFDQVDFVDESYWQLVGDPRRVQLLGQGDEDGQPQPLFWTHEVGPGRVFVSIPGHFAWTFDDPLFRALLLRGIAWTAGESVDRFNDLVPLGARIEQ